jgi:hypothetical protein
MNGAVAALAVAVLLGGAPPQSRTLAAGPALAGDRVVWGEQRGHTKVVVGAGSGAPLWQSRLAWLAGPLAASRSTVAFAANSNGCSGVTACPVETTFFALSLDPGRAGSRSLHPCAACQPRPGEPSRSPGH